MSGWVETLAQSPTCNMDTSEAPAAKVMDTAAPWSVMGDKCAFATPKTFLTQK